MRLFIRRGVNVRRFLYPKTGLFFLRSFSYYSQEFKNSLDALTNLDFETSLEQCSVLFNIVGDESFSSQIRVKVVANCQALLLKAFRTHFTGQNSESVSDMSKTLNERLLKRFENEPLQFVDQLLEIADAQMVSHVIDSI
jgi:hypothetical protein